MKETPDSDVIHTNLVSNIDRDRANALDIEVGWQHAGQLRVRWPFVRLNCVGHYARRPAKLSQVHGELAKPQCGWIADRHKDGRNDQDVALPIRSPVHDVRAVRSQRLDGAGTVHSRRAGKAASISARWSRHIM